MSHYPFFCTGCYAKQLASQYYASMDAEFNGNVNRTAAEIAKKQALELEDSSNSTSKVEVTQEGGWNKELTQSSSSSIADLVPLLDQGGVDMYLAGHWHYYESLWPAKNGETGTGGEPIQHDFINPNVTVHVTTGNGGPPSADNFNEDCPGPDCGSIPATRKQSTEYGYGRLIAHNATHLEYLQIQNKDNAVFDRFFLMQENHGPF